MEQNDDIAKMERENVELSASDVSHFNTINRLRSVSLTYA